MVIQDAPPIDSDALRMAGTLLSLNRVLDQQLRRGTGGDPVTVTELSVLGLVHRGNDAPSTIARALRVDPPRVSRITDHLAERGYMARGLDPDDRRRCVLRLTREGEERLRHGRQEIAASMSGLLEGLTRDERDGLARTLDRVRDLLDGTTSSRER